MAIYPVKNVSAVQSYRGLRMFPPNPLLEALTAKEMKKEGKMIYHWCVRIDVPEKLVKRPGQATLPKDVTPARTVHLDGSLNVNAIKSVAKFNEWRSDIVTTAVRDARSMHNLECDPHHVTLLSMTALSGGLK